MSCAARTSNRVHYKHLLCFYSEYEYIQLFVLSRMAYKNVKEFENEIDLYISNMFWHLKVQCRCWINRPCTCYTHTNSYTMIWKNGQPDWAIILIDPSKAVIIYQCSWWQSCFSFNQNHVCTANCYQLCIIDAPCWW